MQKGYYDAFGLSDELNSLLSPYNENDSAMLFLHGYCSIFALALHDTYGYQTGWLLDGECEDTDCPWDYSLLHIFCVKEEAGETVFIDVRGCQSDEDTFEIGFDGFVPEYHLRVDPEHIRKVMEEALPKERYEQLYNTARYFIEQGGDIYRPA